jgi:hypothetical protein
MMKDDTAEMAKKTMQENETAGKLSNKITALDRCYGEIGIPAVAAAARYQGGAKNPAYAPARPDGTTAPARRPRSAPPFCQPRPQGGR